MAPTRGGQREPGIDRTGREPPPVGQRLPDHPGHRRHGHARPAGQLASARARSPSWRRQPRPIPPPSAGCCGRSWRSGWSPRARRAAWERRADRGRPAPALGRPGVARRLGRLRRAPVPLGGVGRPAPRRADGCVDVLGPPRRPVDLGLAAGTPGGERDLQPCDARLVVGHGAPPCNTYDFSGFSRVADLGGGHGTLLPPCSCGTQTPRCRLRPAPRRRRRAGTAPAAGVAGSRRGGERQLLRRRPTGATPTS